MTEKTSGKKRRWPVIVAAVGGVALGALAVGLLPMFTSGGESAPELPQPDMEDTPKKQKDGPKLSGDLSTVIRDFELEDPEGNVVLKVEKITAALDLDSIGDSQLIKMPRGSAENVKLLLRRGPSGRVSLSEAFRGNSEPHQHKEEKGQTPLQIGPMQVKNVRMTVAMGSSPVIIRVSEATLRITRKLSDLAPKVFLSNIHGELLQPDPLPNPITIEGGEGVVDLAGDPLVDLRTRVCIGDGEMRLRVVMPERQEKVSMTVDAEGAMAKTAGAALNVVSLFKSDKIGVEKGVVEVKEKFTCSDSKSRDARAEVNAREAVEEILKDPQPKKKPAKADERVSEAKEP